MLTKKIIPLILMLFTFNAFADYALDSNEDGVQDIWVEDKAEDGVIISSDTNFDGNVDSILAIDKANISLYEQTDYNLDGVMDNFYYYEDGVIVRQEVDSNYDNKIDVWVYIINGGTTIAKYEKDTDFDGVIDKVKVFEEEEEE